MPGDGTEEPMDGRPTLREIANRTGHSVATVSMALRGSTRVSAATRALVGEVAREIGYAPDPVLAALSSHRWQRRPVTPGSTLAALADGELEGEAGMVERATAYGYRIERFQIGAYASARRLSDVLHNRGIVGVLVGQIFTPGFCAAFDWSRFVSVACSEGYERPPTHLVMPNHFRAVQQAWDRAVERGAKRIGLAILDMPSAVDFHDRCAAFLEKQRGMPRGRVPMLAIRPWRGNDETLRPGEIVHAEAAAIMRDWLARHKPDAVIGFNDYFWWILRDAGWDRPRLGSFISLWIDNPNPRSAGLRLYKDELGRRAVDWVDSLLRLGERGIPRHPGTLAIDLEWQDGEPEA